MLQNLLVIGGFRYNVSRSQMVSACHFRIKLTKSFIKKVFGNYKLILKKQAETHDPIKLHKEVGQRRIYELYLKSMYCIVALLAGAVFKNQDKTFSVLLGWK